MKFFPTLQHLVLFLLLNCFLNRLLPLIVGFVFFFSLSTIPSSLGDIYMMMFNLLELKFQVDFPKSLPQCFKVRFSIFQHKNKCRKNIALMWSYSFPLYLLKLQDYFAGFLYLHDFLILSQTPTKLHTFPKRQTGHPSIYAKYFFYRIKTIDLTQKSLPCSIFPCCS